MYRRLYSWQILLTMDVFNIVLALSALLLCLYYYFTRTFNYWKSRNVPGPKPVVFFGNIKDSALRRRNMGLVYRDIYNSFPNEKVVGLYNMTTPTLLLRDLDVIKHVMIKDFDCFEDRGVEFSKKGLGVNLFHADGETWRVLRNKLTPIFTSGKLKNMLYLMTERGDKFVDYVQKNIQRSNEQEVHELLQKYTLSTISACAFGLDIENLNDQTDILKKIDNLVFNLNIFFELDLMYPGILKKLNLSMFPRETTDFFENLTKKVVTQRNGMPSNKKDFIDEMLELRNKGVIKSSKKYENSKELSLEITDSLMAAQSFVFYVAGYETSATTMSNMLYELAKNPDIQDKLISEIDEVLQKHNGNVTYEALNDMKYLHKVFDETLRMYPLVEPLRRNATVDYKIPGTNVTLKKGQTVLVSPLGIQHDPQYYPEPTKFDPERFEPQLASSRHTCAYMPFGVGPRNCIGMRFAKVQSQICISKFLSKFRVATNKRTEPTMKISPCRGLMGPANGIYLNILPRDVRS